MRESARRILLTIFLIGAGGLIVELWLLGELQKLHRHSAAFTYLSAIGPTAIRAIPPEHARHGLRTTRASCPGVKLPNGG